SYFETSCVTAATSDIFFLLLLFQPIACEITIPVILVDTNIRIFYFFVLPFIDYVDLLFSKCELFDPFIILGIIGFVFRIFFGYHKDFQSALSGWISVYKNLGNFTFFQVIDL